MIRDFDDATLLKLVAAGYTGRQIADRLCASPSTVRNRLQVLYEEHGVHTRTALVYVALCEGRLALADIAEVRDS